MALRSVAAGAPEGPRTGGVWVQAHTVNRRASCPSARRSHV